MLIKRGFGEKNKKGQVTIFIIVAILIIAAVGIYFLVRNNISQTNVPSEFEGIYNDFVVCLEENLESGVGILESQGGYIYLPGYVSGSEYMPFSSQLDFLGVSVPYWYYVSGNNIEREQVPSVNSMEKDLETFIENRAINCFPENFDSDLEISLGEPNAKIGIKKDEVQMNLKADLVLTRGDSTAEISSHEVIVETELGKLHSNAVKVYEEEQKSMFLENYTLDILNLYAPVDGVEFSCASKVWSVPGIFEDVQEAVDENIAVVKVQGDSNNYFVLDTLSNKIPSDVYVDFLTSSSWPTTFEVEPSEGPVLIAKPVGNEFGLGALGFCYVTYHFVYDYKYPVMVQLRSETTGEIFQFPVAVIIENSNPRESLVGESSALDVPEICENANTEFTIITLDSNSNHVNADISFECFSQTCDIGTAENGVLDEKFPQCVNGYIIAKAEGYKDAEVLTSTVNSGSLTIFMDRVYEMELSVALDNSYYSGEAIITFEDAEGNLNSVLYPEQDTIGLSAGTYEISVSVYKDVSLEFGSVTSEYCTEVPRNILGVFGLTKTECYEIEVPEQLISRALSGGGVGTVTFLENDLRNNNEILINVEKFPEPDSLVQIQENSVLFENKIAEVSLR